MALICIRYKLCLQSQFSVPVESEIQTVVGLTNVSMGTYFTNCVRLQLIIGTVLISFSRDSDLHHHWAVYIFQVLQLGDRTALLQNPVEVIAFCDEEGIRYDQPAPIKLDIYPDHMLSTHINKKSPTLPGESVLTRFQDGICGSNIPALTYCKYSH